MLICGGVPHAGHSLANELICLPHLEHGIKAIGGSVVTRSCCRCQIPFKPSQLINIADAHRSEGKRYLVHADVKLTAFVELERSVWPSRKRL